MSGYQSLPRTSPPAGVIADHQVVPLTPGATERTLPSPRPTLMLPVWGVLARLPSQVEGFPVQLLWNSAAGPVGWSSRRMR